MHTLPFCYDCLISHLRFVLGLYALYFCALFHLSLGYTCIQEGYTYPDDTNCRNYFMCQNGSPVKYTCPGMLYWNCTTSTCARIRRGSCCPQDTSLRILGVQVRCINGMKIPDLSTCNKYYLCEKGAYQPYYCPIGSRFDALLMRCRTARIGNCATKKTTTTTTVETTLPADTTTSTASVSTASTTKYTLPPWNVSGSIPDVLNCNKYYTYVNGSMVKKTCPNNEYYNCWQRACSTKRSPLCCTTIPYISNSVSCPTNGVINSIPLSCSSYYECANNVVVRKRCPSFQAFDAWTSTCKSPISARCSIKPGLTVCQASSGGSLPIGSLNFNITVVCPKW